MGVRVVVGDQLSSKLIEETAEFAGDIDDERKNIAPFGGRLGRRPPVQVDTHALYIVLALWGFRRAERSGTQGKFGIQDWGDREWDYDYVSW